MSGQTNRSSANLNHHHEEDARKKVDALSTHRKIVTSLVAGSLAGASAKTAIAPLDRAKINFQVRKTPFSYKLLTEFLRNDLKNYGFFNLWRGNSATMIRVMPSAAINFTSHEQYKRILHVDRDSRFRLDFVEPARSPFKRFLAGSLAGFTAASLTYPLDVARARMAVTNKAQFKNIVEIFVQAYRTEGIRMFYRGYTPSLLGVIPYAGSGYFVYETCKLYHRDLKKREPYPYERLVYGAMAGATSQTLSYPFDIIRRRMQTSAVINNQEVNLTIYQLVRKILREEGLVKGFYKGLSMNWIKGPIAAAIGFCTYDILQFFIRKTLYYKKPEPTS